MATGVHDKEKTLYRQVAQKVEAGMPDVEVLALELTGREQVRVYVDHPAGVDHALCARVTTILRPLLDEYAVEVSSPGFDRPLRTRAHFEQAVGRQVRLRTGERAFAARWSRRGSGRCSSGRRRASRSRSPTTRSCARI